jgi:ubiquitin carboxyl-terminal hydrolase 8
MNANRAFPSVTAESIEDSLSVAPSIEYTLFSNRDKFDLVVMYDDCSNSYGPLFQALSRAIYETAFRKMLKRMPVLLIGGLQAWRQEFGDAEVGHGSPDNLGEVSHRGRPHRHSEQKERRGHGVNGTTSISHTGGRHLPGADAPSMASAAYRNRSQTESATSAPRMPSIPRSDGMRFTPDQMAGAGPSRTSVPPLSRKPPMSPPTQYPAPQPINNVCPMLLYAHVVH